MPLTLGSEVAHHGKTLIVGHAGRLYEPRLSVDARGRTRRTQKRTKYRIVACACGSAFIAHDGRMKICETCRVQAQQTRNIRQASEVPPPATIACAQCGHRVIAQRSTRRYCSRACQQAAYRERRPNEPRAPLNRPK